MANTNTSITTDQLNTVLYATENGNNPATLRSFSYAGGGTSSYSFGVLQLDVGTNHGNVQGFLQQNGFSSDQIAALSQHGGLSSSELATLDTQLQAIPQATMDTYINQQLTTSVDHVDSLVGSLQTANPGVASAISGSPELQLALADYDNQFTISGVGQPARPNTMLSYLEGNPVHLPGGTLQLGDTISRTDIQNFINATKYGQENPTSVHNREQRLVGALDALNIDHTPAQSTGGRPGPAPAGGSVLKEGDNSAAVHTLQTQLNQLGAHVQEDGKFGPGTKAAVETFQQAHQLTPDGVVGSKTEQAIQQAMQQHQAPTQAPTQTPAGAPATPAPQAAPAAAPAGSSLTDPANPGHELFQQARNAVYQLDAQQGRQPDQSSDNMAAALTVAAQNNGMTRIDKVLLSDDATRAWAVQGDLQSPFKQYTDVGITQAVNTTVAQSSAAFNQAAQQQNGQTQNQTQQQQQQQQQQQMPAPAR